MLNLTAEFLKLIKIDLFSGFFRFNVTCTLANHFPGKAGGYLRTVLLSKYLAAVGENSRFMGSVTIIHPENLYIGKHVLFSKEIYIQASGMVTVDDYTIFGPSVKIWSLNHIFTDPEVWIPEQGYEYLPVKIGKKVWVGANVFIMPGASIGDYCIVSAGAVVGAKKYPPGSILAGNPARKIGTRFLPDKLKG